MSAAAGPGLGLWASGGARPPAGPQVAAAAALWAAFWAGQSRGQSALEREGCPGGGGSPWERLAGGFAQPGALQLQRSATALRAASGRETRGPASLEGGPQQQRGG